MTETNWTYQATAAIDKQFWDYFESGSSYNASLSVETGEGAGAVLGVYALLLCAGVVGNLAVLAALARSRRRSRVDVLMTHLAVADVCVTCGVIPLEIKEKFFFFGYSCISGAAHGGPGHCTGRLTQKARNLNRISLNGGVLVIMLKYISEHIGWKFTNAWLAGNLCCKLVLVLRAFGLYLSSNVLVCISLDRFFAVLYPLRLPVARRRSKQMLCCAWAMALACSLPQSVVFSVKQHPVVSGFSQCVSFDAFSSPRQEVAYNVFCLCAVYFVPLAVITACYVCIFCEIHKNSREIDAKGRSDAQPVRLRRSDRRVLERARRRTLRMTVTIVCVFALCWLPYATMAMWYMVDRDSAQRVSSRVQGLLFAMAVSNSCMNPLVYGSYCLDLRGAARRLCKKACCVAAAASDTLGHSGSSSVKRNVNVETPLVIKNGRVRPRLGVRFAETTLSTPAPRAPA